MAKERLTEIVKLARQNIKELVNKEPLGVISLTTEGDKTIVLIEVLERKAIPDTQNLIGEYKLTFDKNNDLLNYSRVAVRRRGDTQQKVSEEEPK